MRSWKTNRLRIRWLDMCRCWEVELKTLIDTHRCILNFPLYRVSLTKSLSLVSPCKPFGHFPYKSKDGLVKEDIYCWIAKSVGYRNWTGLWEWLYANLTVQPASATVFLQTCVWQGNPLWKYRWLKQLSYHKGMQEEFASWADQLKRPGFSKPEKMRLSDWLELVSSLGRDSPATSLSVGHLRPFLSQVCSSPHLQSLKQSSVDKYRTETNKTPFSKALWILDFYLTDLRNTSTLDDTT